MATKKEEIIEDMFDPSDDLDDMVIETSDDNECSPEEYMRLHMKPGTEMMEVTDDYNGKVYKMPKIDEKYLAKPKKKNEKKTNPNDPKVTLAIITGMVVYVAALFWLCL